MQFDAGSLISSCMRMHKMLCLMLSIYCGLAQLKYQPANVSKPHEAIMEPNVNNGAQCFKGVYIACRVDK
jgi:hypothetical protein